MTFVSRTSIVDDNFSSSSFTNVSYYRALSIFFTFGQVLPTHRSMHSQHGGLFQPTITECIRLLSRGPFTPTHATPATTSFKSPDIDDPFTSSALTYSTNGTDTFPAPSAYLNRRHAWVHVFPEGKVHQHPSKTIRYFKWGISRMILESEPLPTIVPIFIDGLQNSMHEERGFPRFLPRIRKNISISFGDPVDGESIFGELRSRWQTLVKKEMEFLGLNKPLKTGELTEGLMYGNEAIQLRIECTRRVRQQVLKVRRSLGLPDEDPKESLAKTWRLEGLKQEGKMRDGSWVKDM